MEEVWKDVVGYEQFFKISSFGRVWSKRTDRILKLVVHQNGYHIFATRLHGRNSKGLCLKVHRLVAEAFIANPYNKPFVNHIDGVKTNNTIDNLEWVTSSENAIHARDTGLSVVASGTNSPLCKVDVETILEIKRLYSTGRYSHRDLGKMYSVSHSAIQRYLVLSKELVDLQSK